MKPTITLHYPEDDSEVQFYFKDGQWYHRFRDETTGKRWTQGYPNTLSFIVECIKTNVGRDELRKERA
jgi:hypothetical protein